jgi:hypothetical protein
MVSSSDSKWIPPRDTFCMPLSRDGANSRAAPNIQLATDLLDANLQPVRGMSCLTVVPNYSSMIPRLAPIATACVRSFALSLARMFRM